MQSESGATMIAEDENFISSYSVCGIYQVTHLLGRGSDGDVVRAFNINTGSEVAIEDAARSNKEEDQIPIVKYEAMVHALIPDGTEGFPSIHYAGNDANHCVMVMDRLGPNLSALRRVCRGSFTLRTICMLAEQMLRRIQFLHSRGVVSCDIKPHNFAMGHGETAKIVYMFDFALAKPYLLADTGEHIPFSTGGRAIGTVRYASVAAHQSHSVSRADDIESLLYVILEFFHGTLPWEGLPAPPSMKRSLIHEMKADSSPTGFLHKLLARSPPEFAAYHAHVTRLTYGEEPDYAQLRALFRARMRTEGWTCDWVYDWMDASGLQKGTLLPEEYNASTRFVEEREWNPNYM